MSAFGPSSIIVWVIDSYGVITLILAIIAISLGVISLIKRSRTASIMIGFTLAGIACAGIAISAWNMLDAFIPIDGYSDPASWANKSAGAWIHTFTVMFGCSAGFGLVALSLLRCRQEP